MKAQANFAHKRAIADGASVASGSVRGGSGTANKKASPDGSPNETGMWRAAGKDKEQIKDQESSGSSGKGNGGMRNIPEDAPLDPSYTGARKEIANASVDEA